MDDPALRHAEPLGRLGDLALVRWHDAVLPADLADLLAEAEISGVAWLGDFPDAWRRRPFTDAGEALFLALRGAVPVAMAVISADPHVEDRDTGRLRFIYVGQAVRDRGLLRAFVDLALTHGHGRWRRLRLHTDNPTAARVYESYGFRPASDENRSTHVRESP